MFERFTADARAVVVGAQEEARSLRHRHIGTEHLLLALVRLDQTAAATLLRESGLDHDRVRAEVTRLVSSGGLGELDAAALEAIGIDLGAVRAKLEESFGPGVLDGEPPAQRRGMFRRKAGGGHIPFTPRAKKVLELSLREAIALRGNEIRAEHLLLGLLREGQGLAAKVIADAGVDAADLRSRTIGALRKAA